LWLFVGIRHTPLHKVNIIIVIFIVTPYKLQNLKIIQHFNMAPILWTPSGKLLRFLKLKSASCRNAGGCHPTLGTDPQMEISEALY
jgi:hypothetical protein